MRRFALVTAALAAFAVVPHQVEAQVTLGPELAYGDGSRDLGIGAAMALPMPNIGTGFGLLVDLLIFFPNGYDYLEANGNITYDFELENSSAVPFVLAGLSLSNTSVEVLGVSGSSTDLALNLGGGIDFDLGSFRPKVGARFQIESGTGFILFATLPFAIGN